MTKILVFMTLAVRLLTFSGQTTGQSPAAPTAAPPPSDTAIPDQFRASYQELDDTLRHANQTYPFQKADPRPLVAPCLTMASSFYCPSTADPQPWKDLLATLDAFKAMNMKAVLVQIAAPDLAVGDTHALVDYYQRLAREIHSRDMKLYVEHFVNVPFQPNLPPGSHADKNSPTRIDLRDDPQGRKDFLDILEKENSLIYREIQPDYLSVLTEPEASIIQTLHLSFSADELANWVGELTTRLKNTGASPNTLLGAGAVTSEPEDFVLKFAQQPNLDYVDLHLYFLKMKGEDQIAKLATLVGKIRQDRPNMKITIGEAWLFKHSKQAPKVTSISEIFSRDSFSFWSPLDQQFLTLLMGMAQKENISVVVPYFSQYLFAYYTFGDAESSKLPPWPRSIPQSWNKAFESLRNHQLSPTGKALRAMLAPAAN
ncbi:MAG TPA: hypothetical protein VMP11_19515 [Verrucomicrobiae bacterium]|nr:hypothetical protein [Verrucomicrobiae bacterium]